MAADQRRASLAGHDRRGGDDRAAGCAAAVRDAPDFLFVQMQSPELAAKEWEPAYVDYLYLSFTNSTAFSPTDVMPLSRWAKLAMMVQSAVSLVVVALVVARAVNVLGDRFTTPAAQQPVFPDHQHDDRQIQRREERQQDRVRVAGAVHLIDHEEPEHHDRGRVRRQPSAEQRRNQRELEHSVQCGTLGRRSRTCDARTRTRRYRTRNAGRATRPEARAGRGSPRGRSRAAPGLRTRERATRHRSTRLPRRRP